MRKQKTLARSSDIEVLGIKDFYNQFVKEKRRYAPSLFCIGTKTKLKRKKPVELKLYKKIILEYLKLYFYDFYMNQNSIYFPLGGFLKKVVYPKWVRMMRRGSSEKQLSGGDKAIGLFWYMRATKKMFYMVELKKLTGSTNRLPKIEAACMQNSNKDLLPIFKTEIKKARKNKTLYLCTPT
jgi:hypothetical protein